MKLRKAQLFLRRSLRYAHKAVLLQNRKVKEANARYKDETSHRHNEENFWTWVIAIKEWTFLEYKDIDPTSDLSERSLRHVVVKRKISQ